MPEIEKHGIAERLHDTLTDLHAKSQFRTLGISGGINLCSNDYLGLADDPRLKQAVIDAVANAQSMGSAGSRLLSGNRAEWEELEREFADFAGTESALYFGSGYAANVGLLSSILRPSDVVLSDALNHASLIDGIRLSRARKIIYPHLDLSSLEKYLRELRKQPGTKVIVTETVFSMEGDIAPLPELVNLVQAYGAELVLDEAHATGVYGPEGRGIAAESKCVRDILAIVHTCGKALASAGAFVCGGTVLKNFLVNRARTFIFSTAMPPYFAGHISAALDLARQADAQRNHLRAIASLLRDELRARGLNCGSSASHIVPINLGANEVALHVAARLQANGFAAKAIRPPTVLPGTARIRLSLTSRITAEDIHRIVAVIAAANPTSHDSLLSSPVHV